MRTWKNVKWRVIDMTIDEPIEKHKKLKINAERNNDKRGAFYSGEEHKQIAEWLEELKAIKSDGFTDDLLNMGFTKGYNKAIDDFVEHITLPITTEEQISEIVEQLKKEN